MQLSEIQDGLNLILRWIHVIAGIMWIGSSLFFNWLDSHLEEPVQKKTGVEGELWMVHSGGFYQVEKKLVAPEALPKNLHWFKWEAGFTWLSGIFLLIVVFYMGGGILLVDTNHPTPPSLAMMIGLGSLPVAWFIYDFLWKTLIQDRKVLGFVISFGLLSVLTYVFSHFFSGRAAYIHVGAVLGTLMAVNVWVRIIPAQRSLVSAIKTGGKPDAALAKNAKQRSRHNNIMTYPVIFIMISNHFPSTFGHPSAWIILLALFLGGAAVRFAMNARDFSPKVLLGVLGAFVLVAFTGFLSSKTTPPQAARTEAVAASAPVSAGPMLSVLVEFDGVLKDEAKLIQLPPGCAELHPSPPSDNRLLTNEKKVANAFVWISEGAKNDAAPPPAQEIVLDQKGCLYLPRVIGAQVGQSVTFVNSDPVFHNVRTIEEKNANPSINLAMPAQDMRITKTFDQEQIMVHAKCDVHPWMNAYIGVVSHPHFGVTDYYGIAKLPAPPNEGNFVVSVWHEVLGRKDTRIVLGKTQTTPVLIRMSRP